MGRGVVAPRPGQAVTPAGPKRTGGCAAFPAAEPTSCVPRGPTYSSTAGMSACRAAAATAITTSCRSRRPLRTFRLYRMQAVSCTRRPLRSVITSARPGCTILRKSMTKRSTVSSPRTSCGCCAMTLSPLDPRVCLRDGMSVFEGAHTGYRRLPDPVEPWRRIELRADGGELRIEDTFRGAGSHEVSIPLQLAAGWRVSERAAQQLSCLHTGGARLAVRWSGTGAWQLLQEAGRVAASYGVTTEAVRLRWLARGPVAPLALRVVIERV